MSSESAPVDLDKPRGWLSIIGPAIIVASVVLGPGSILISSKIGAQFGYSMLWVLVVAGLLMIAMVALAGRLGVTLPRTLCEELAVRLGRPVAVAVGVIVFAMITAFQTSNNLAVIAAIEPLFGDPDAATPGVPVIGPGAQTATLLALNGCIIAVLYGFRHLYKPIERLMMILVGVMLIGFAGNLLFARPSIAGALGGLVPTVPDEVRQGLLPRIGSGGAIVDPLLNLTGLIGTTFSIAGAFYQAYLVREKGWTLGELRRGMVDSIAGIAVLGGISAVIMITSAAVFAGRADILELRSAADVALQLEPLFGSSAKYLFTVGLLCAAFSSFLVNVMIGGVVLSDGLGKGGRIDQPWPRALTVAALLISMSLALVMTWRGGDIVGRVVFTQAMVVLGLPALALALLYLATRKAETRGAATPFWMKAAAGIACVLTLALAVRTAWRIVLSFS